MVSSVIIFKSLVLFAHYKLYFPCIVFHTIFCTEFVLKTQIYITNHDDTISQTVLPNRQFSFMNTFISFISVLVTLYLFYCMNFFIDQSVKKIKV